MTSAPHASWAFVAVDGVNVQCPIALDNGVARIVGKTYDAATGAYVLASEPHAYRLARSDAARLRSLFAKALRLGHLLPADAATAAAFGVRLPAPALSTASQEP